MPIRITGLNSGLDTESIISALVSSYSYKTSKYKKAQTKLSWKQEAWSTLNSKVYSFYNNVGKLKLSSAYNMRTASVSDSTKAKVSGSNAVPDMPVVGYERVTVTQESNGTTNGMPMSWTRRICCATDRKSVV